MARRAAGWHGAGRAAIPSTAQAVDGMEVLTGLASDPFSIWGMSRNGQFLVGVTDGGSNNYRG